MSPFDVEAALRRQLTPPNGEVNSALQFQTEALAIPSDVRRQLYAAKWRGKLAATI